MAAPEVLAEICSAAILTSSRQPRRNSQENPKGCIVMSEAALSSSTGRVIRERCALVPTRPGNFINRVINADCLDVLPRLPSRSVDFVLTDPPYLARYRDRTGRSVENDNRDRWLAPAFAEIYRVLKNDRFCVSFYGWPRGDSFFAARRGAGRRPFAPSATWSGPNATPRPSGFSATATSRPISWLRAIRLSRPSACATCSPGTTPATACTRRKNRCPR